MKNSVVILILLTIVSLNNYSQDFISSIKDNNTNYKQLKITLNQDMSILENLTPRELKQFGRWDWYWKTRMDSSGRFQRMQEEMIKYIEKEQRSGLISGKKSTPTLSWTSLGPKTRPGSETRTTGRGLVSTIWVDPDDYDHILIGASNGGLWKTENGGTNWSCRTEGILLGGVTDIAVHPTNKNIIYLGTQVRAANGSHLGMVSQYSLGLYKTTDGGDTWTKLNTSVIPVEDYYQRILIHPTTPSTVYALTIKGIYKSTNSGSTWTSIGPYLPSGNLYYYYDMEFKPNDPNTIYVSGANTFEKSTNGGANWTSLLGNLVNVFDDARIAIAVDANNPNYIYALYSDRPDGYYADVGFEQSTNAGSSWIVKQSPGSNLDAAGFLTKVWVSTDSDVFAGGIRIKKSSNEGSTFGNNLETGYIHRDIRDLCFPDPNDGDLIYTATDGGVYMDDQDGSSWSRITGDLALNEFYSVGITQQDPEIMIGGSQDCGSVKRNTDGSWTHVAGGDGGIALINQQNHNVYYTTRNRAFFRNSTYITTLGNYDSPVIMDPTNSDILYRDDWVIGDSPPVHILKSTNQGSNWSTETQVYNHMWDLTICENDPNAYYFTTYDIWSSAKIFSCPNGGSSCTEVNYSGISDIVQIAPATNIFVNPFDKDIVWVTFGGFESGKKVYYSNNGGNSWVNHTFTGLPNVPVQSFTYDFLNENLYVGTDIGAFYKSIHDNEWQPAGDLPQVMITELLINKSSGDLVASTFGRGMYRTHIGGGYCYDASNPITINSYTSWFTDLEICSDITIASGGTLNIYGTTTLSYKSTITVQSNGTLKINAGEIVNGKIVVQNGGSIEILNNGIIDLNYEDHLQVESGGSLEIISGEINLTTIIN